MRRGLLAGAIWLATGSGWPAGWDPGLVNERLEVGGDTRTWVLYRPHFLPAPGARLPLVIALHGGGGTGKGMVTFTKEGFNRLADRDGFFVAYPAGKKFFLRKRGWNDGRAAHGASAYEHHVDDGGRAGHRRGWRAHLARWTAVPDREAGGPALPGFLRL